jgi:hypothetical protein
LRIPSSLRRLGAAGSLLGALALLPGAPATAAATGMSLGDPYVLSPDYGPGDRFMGVRLLGHVRLASVDLRGRRLGGLSGLAWDEEAELLYAISDTGDLHHLLPRFEGELLHDVEHVASYRLRDAEGHPLRGALSDSEGLDLLPARDGEPGETRLLVSFERRPRVAEYTREGRFLREHPLPPDLRRARAYQHPNRALESVTLHPTLGVLTAPEYPLRGESANVVPIVSLEGHGRWPYHLSDTPNSGLTALEALPDGSILALERGYGRILFLPIVISLRLIAPPVPGRPLEVREVAVFDSSDGFSLDNFEGLAHYRDRRFFMVSDDNFRFPQRTLLMHFELLPDDAPAFKPSASGPDP